MKTKLHESVVCFGVLQCVVTAASCFGENHRPGPFKAARCGTKFKFAKKAGRKGIEKKT